MSPGEHRTEHPPSPLDLRGVEAPRQEHQPQIAQPEERSRERELNNSVQSRQDEQGDWKPR
jgi:hypothetical protein